MTTYFVQSPSGSVKIGRSKNIKKRLQHLRNGKPGGVCLLGVLHEDREQELHRRFRPLRIKGEWFNPGQELLDFISTSTKKSIGNIKDESVVLRFTLSRHDLVELKRAAAKEHRSVSNAVRSAVRRWLASQRPQKQLQEVA